MSDVRDGLLCLEVTERETGSLPHDTVLVLQQTNQVVHHVVAGVASPTKRHGSHCPHVGVFVLEQLNQSIHHGWVLELGCGGLGKVGEWVMPLMHCLPKEPRHDDLAKPVQ